MEKKLKERIIRLCAPFRRLGLKNRDYSIISNNCWGGIKTRNYGLPYRFPTCGTFFFAKEYLKFLSDLKGHLAAELLPLSVSESRYADILYPKYGDALVLGRVLDAEIVFLHYDSFAEAKEKWDRRKTRVNFDNLLVKFNDQNGFQPEDYDTFAALPFEHKIFFTAHRELRGKPYTVYFDRYEKQGYVVDDIKPSNRYFNLKKYLNGMIL